MMKSSALDMDLLSRKAKFKMPICANLLGANFLEKSHQTASGMASIFSKSFRSSILPHFDPFHFAFRDNRGYGP